jgi:hypothetical protein
VRTRSAMAAAVMVVGLASSGPSAAQARPLAPPVIAIVGETPAINVLHDDFLAPGPVVYPVGMPRPVIVDLPRDGDFASRLEQLRRTPLGSPRAGTLYALRGTRLLLFAATGQEDFLGPDRLHATGVVSSAIGRRHGTAPEALAVHIAGTTPAAYDWLAAQNTWIDVASTSVYSIRSPRSDEPTDTPVCLGAAAVRRFVASGRVFFTSSGNTTDQPEPLVSPNGLPEAYQVGGAGADGRTWLPGHVEEQDPFFAAGNVVRPYETSELFSFPAAAPDSVSGSTHFGGTSGATPRTAGRAAVLLASARAAVGRATPGSTFLAGHGPRSRAPKAGPLADGTLTGGELERLLRVSAAPAEAVEGARYALEGYGAVTDQSLRHAHAVLRGAMDAPERPRDDEAHEAAEAQRAALFAGRC